ncbi:MAG: AAA-like domain-containing protein, partial [Chloroflexota bacterium]
AQPAIQARFGIDSDNYIFLYQDFQLLRGSTVPTRFWQRVLRGIKRVVKDREELVDEIEIALKSDSIDNYALDDIFTLIDDEDLYVVLLLDEFENVTRNEHFDNDFFGGLRALAIHHNLALITSSRKDLVDLTHSDTLRSSPFFNIFTTINLRSFSEEDATQLISSYLANTDVSFLPSELNVVFAIAGYHPSFLQMACQALFTAHQKGLDKANRRSYLVDQTHPQIVHLFQDYWHESGSSEQILLAIFTMKEMENKEHEASTEELEGHYTRAAQVLPELERRSLVIKDPETSDYHLFSTELSEWIADEIVGHDDDLRAWRDWQKDEKTLVGDLPLLLQNMLSDVVNGLNPAYRKILGNWLLEPTTANSALILVGNFMEKYEQYKVTRPNRAAVTTMADEQAPVGDTPKGLFARVNAQLESRGAVSSQKKAPTSKMAPKPKPAPTPAPTPPPASTASLFTQASSGRVLGSKSKKSAPSPVAIGGLVISSIVTALDLDTEDEEFVNGELKWLFSAMDTLLKVSRNELDRTHPIPVVIPPDARKTEDANNKILDTVEDEVLRSWKGWAETRLDWINSRLKELDILLGQEASRGIAAKSDIELQNKITEKRLEAARIIEDLARMMSQAYGILVTTPGQIVGLLEEQ